MGGIPDVVRIGGQGGGGMGGNSPPQPPISYLVTYELFETLMYCVPPPSTKTRAWPPMHPIQA